MARPDDGERTGPYVNVAGDRGPGGPNLTLLSGGAGGRLPPSINPPAPTSPVAIMQEQRRLAQDMLVSTERMATYLSTAAEKAQAIAEALDARGSSFRGSTGRGGGREGPAHTGEEPADTAHRRSGKVSPASSGGVRPAREVAEEGGAFDQPYQAKAGSPYSLRTLRSDAARAVGRRLQNWQIGPSLVEDPNPTAAAEGVMRHIDRTTGAIGEVASAEEVAAATRGAQVTGGVRNFLGGIVAGEGPMAALQGGLAKAAPMVAGGVGIAAAGWQLANRTRDFANAQRAANAQYQSILGGSNAEGFGERTGERMFAIRQSWFGGMGGKQAEELYRGAAGIYGRDDFARQNAEDFGTYAWRNMGMSVRESLQLVSIEAKSGNAALANLAGSLRLVTASAREAGVSAEQARSQMFGPQLAAVGQNISGGAAPVVAGGLATFQAGLGNQYTGLDLTGLNSMTSITQQAAISGMTRGQYLAASQRDPSVMATGQTAQMQLIAGQVLGGERAKQWVVSEVQKRGIKKGDQGAWQSLAADFLSTFRIDPMVAATAFGTITGVQIQPGIAGIAFLLQLFDVENNPAALVKQQVADTQQTGIDQKDRGVTSEYARQRAKDMGIDPALWNALADPGATGAGSATSAYLAGKGSWGEVDVALRGSDVGRGSGRDDIQKVGTLLNELQTGVRNPIAEKIAALPDARRYRWNVQTKEGPREVDTTTLLTMYQDQVQSGSVTVASGPKGEKGQDIATLVGAPTQAGLSTPSAGESAATGPGVKESDNVGTVQIAFLPEVARFFTAITAGAAYYPGALYSGRPSPSATPAGPGTTPTG